MVELRKETPTKKPHTSQNRSLTEVLETTNFNANQKRARTMINNLGLSQEQKDLLFIVHLWHESGSLNLVKKLTGIKNSVDMRGSLGKLMDSDELVKQYDDFYVRYRATESDQD